MSRPEACQLLNTIDQNGWFSFDPEVFNYDPAFGPREGGPTHTISVNAWSTRSVDYAYLADFVYERFDLEDYEDCRICDPPPAVVPALSSTFKLLDSFRPNSLRFAEDEVILVSVRDMSGFSNLGELEPWPVNFFSLAETWETSACEYLAYRTLVGKEAADLKAFLNSHGPEFTDKESPFQVFYIDIIPEAVFPACGDWSYEPSGYSLPNLHRNLTCSPADGTFQPH